MPLKSGDPAPDFETRDQDGNPVRLSDFRGKKVVLFFYPKDDTPGCTAEACDLRDNYDRFLAQGYAVLGVSVDDEQSHRKFIQKFNLPFPLLADTDHHLVNDYGVWGEKNMYGRTFMGITRKTFVIDEAGVIADVIEKVNTQNHSSQILK